MLTSIRRDLPAATEAAFKYFLLGAFSSAFFLYGIAFTYGVTGSTHLDRIGRVIAAQAMAPTPMQLLALGLLLVGFGFKVSAVPFHMWTPDAYEGAPPAVTGFMSTGVKAAAFAAFVRVFLSAFEPLRSDWAPVIWVVAAATMILGTVVGVAQSNVKRMLAYSSIAHGAICCSPWSPPTMSERGGSSSISSPARSRTSARSGSSRCSTTPIVPTIG
jgi:NADH-quinone oxidoreductase subunit N